MSESSESPIQGERFWREHILTAQNFMGTNVEYCRGNGLNPATFSAYKVKLGLSKSKKQARSSAFVQITREVAVSTGPALLVAAAKASPAQPPVIPEAKWVAEFVAALFGQK